MVRAVWWSAVGCSGHCSEVNDGYLLLRYEEMPEKGRFSSIHQGLNPRASTTN